MRRYFKLLLWFQQLHLILGLNWKKSRRMRWKQNLPAVTMLNKTRAPRNWKKCVRDTKGGNLYARHKAREKLAKVKTTLFCFCYSRCRKELFLFRLFAMKGYQYPFLEFTISAAEYSILLAENYSGLLIVIHILPGGMIVRVCSTFGVPCV